MRKGITAAETGPARIGSRGRERRRQIIRRSAQLFDEYGYHNATMEDIAQSVEIQKSTLYYYFRSKDQILFEIHQEFIELLIERHLADRSSQPRASLRLLGIMTAILELMDDYRGHVRVFFEHHRELDSAQRRSISERRDYYREIVEEVLVEGIRSGEFRDLDVRLTTMQIFGMCNWAYQWYRKGGRLTAAELARVFWDGLLHGIETGAHRTAR
jgi:AcrR family transcriptional regulator